MKRKNHDQSHTFVICAYRESPYLVDCIKSLRAQTVPSGIIMITSTPNPYINGIAERYGIECRVNDGEKGIAGDWNYAYRIAHSRYVTLVHQDDIYRKDYVKEVLKAMGRAENPVIAFTDYYELRNGELQKDSTMLKVKRSLLLPLILPLFHKSRFVRRRILSLGCPICCPSVTYHKDNLPEQIFKAGYRSDVDWQAWELLSKRKGEFVYIRKPLTVHRIHEGSATTAIIGDHVRSKEDYDMFRLFWPACIARILANLYARSECSNELKKRR